MITSDLDPDSDLTGHVISDQDPCRQCCGSVMFIPDPGSGFFPIPDPGSRISDPGSRIPDPGSNQKGGGKIYFLKSV